MKRKKRGDKSAGPKTASPARTTGQLPQSEKEQNRVGGVQKNVCEMISAGVFSKKLCIEHERKPGQRMPVAGMPGGKCPDDIAPTKPCQDVRVLGYIEPVVISDERVMSGARKERQ